MPLLIVGTLGISACRSSQPFKRSLRCPPEGRSPDDLALLSLREPKLYRLSEAGRYESLGEVAAEKIAEGFRQAIDDARQKGNAEQPIAPAG